MTTHDSILPITLRPSRDSDWPQLWPLLQTTFRRGDTYAVAADISAAQAHQLWLQAPSATYVASAADGRILGTYYIKPNQAGNGDHVCNCGYIVSADARGHGIATTMCEHSQSRARELGFAAMQFNCVVATNHGAIRLWQRLGFAIVGTLPQAFRHPQAGMVDAHVMYKWLAS